MPKMIGYAAICSFVLGSVGLAQDAAAGEALDLQNGKYELRLLTPQMPEGNKDIALPAEVELKNDEIVIQTQGMLGNKVTLRGMASDGTIKAGMTEVEKSSIISFHYIGKVQTKQHAQGKFHCFIDGKAGFAGEWILSKKETPKKTAVE